MTTQLTEKQSIDTLVIGAGPAGLGTALALMAVGDLGLGVVERGSIGQTFRDWPSGQRFLTPSFTTNGFGTVDLNAIHPATSPAFSLGNDYLSGPEYARYLEGVAGHFQIPLLTSVEAQVVAREGDLFRIATNSGTVRARTVVWAGGEFHEPLLGGFPGASLADHSSTAAAWKPRNGELVVIGGYESGVELACHHAERGASVTVVDPSHPWDDGTTGSDPSYNLAPRTRQRLARARAAGYLTFLADGPVTAVKADGDGEFLVEAGERRLRSQSRPVLATGYGPGLGPVSPLFARRPDGWPELTDDDESTITPGLFLSGPAVRHGHLKFCFVYKYRQRYAHIARVIGERLGKDCSQLEKWRVAGMLTDDLSCCGVECSC